MALRGIYRGEIFNSQADHASQQGMIETGSATGWSRQVGGGRFGEDVWADDVEAGGGFCFDIQADDYTGDTIFVTCNFYFDVGTDQWASSPIINMSAAPSASSDSWSIEVDSAGNWWFANDANASFYPTSVAPEVSRIKGKSWNTLEISVFQSATNGIATVKLNGITCIDAVNVGNVDTAGNWNYVGFWGMVSDALNEHGIWYGDTIINDDTGSTFTGFIGDFRFESLQPDADGSTVDWTRNSGSNDWEMLDDTMGTPDDDTTYIESTANDEDAYVTFPATSLTDVNDIHFVASMSRARDDAGSSPLQVQQIALSNAVVGTGGDKAVAVTYEWVVDMFEIDPDTTGAWTKTIIDAAEFGIRSKA